MMHNAGKTLDNLDCNYIDVWECDVCGFREKSAVKIDDCPACRERINRHHHEEAMAGII